MSVNEKIAVLIDVDGTLVSPYFQGKRKIHPTSTEAIRKIVEHAEVFLWSCAGADNGERLLKEFPELQKYIRGSFGKQDFPKNKFDKIFCIEDEALDEEVLSENYVILNDTYNGEEDSGVLLEAVRIIIDEISKNT